MISGRELSNRSFQIDALDGFRGLAVMAVFLSHTSNAEIFILPFLDFSGIGKSGVFLFFLLSSFLLTFPFLVKKEQACSAPFLLNYLLRRIFRIYPLYIVVLLVSLATTAVMWKVLSMDEQIGLPLTLNIHEFFTHITLQEGKSMAWSIAVEFKYYFVLPFLGFLYAIVLKNRLWWCFAATIALIVAVEMVYPQAQSLRNDPRMSPYLPIFFIGGFLAVCQHNWNQNREYLNERYKKLLQIMAVASALIIIFIIPSVHGFFRGTEIPYNHFHKNFIEYALLWSVMIFCVVNGGGVLRWFFESKILRYLGHISFSVYLLHGSVIALFRSFLGAYKGEFWYAVTILAIVIAISHISFLIFERPFSKIRFNNLTLSTRVFGRQEAKLVGKK